MAGMTIGKWRLLLAALGLMAALALVAPLDAPALHAAPLTVDPPPTAADTATSQPGDRSDALQTTGANPNPQAEPGSDPAVEPQSTLEEAIRYSRTQLTLSLVATAWSWIVLAAILFTGLSAWMRDHAQRLLSGRRGVLALYLLTFGVVTSLASLPLGYYSGFVVEHQFDLSTETTSGWLLDQVKGFGLNFLVSVPIVAALYWMIRRWPRWWWLGTAGMLILVTVVFATLAPVVMNPMFNSYRPVQDQALVSRIQSMASDAGVKVSAVLEEDTSQRTLKANAYFTGIGPTRRIILTDNLLENFSQDEIVVVVAHELGHQVHEDIWRSIALGSALYLVGAYLLYRMITPLISRAGPRFGFRRLGDVASLPLLLLLFGVLSFVATPILNSYSRHVEHQADVYALELTRDPVDFISSMEKLGRMNLSDPNPPKPLEVLFYTHPSIQERVDYARSFEATQLTPAPSSTPDRPAPPEPFTPVRAAQPRAGCWAACPAQRPTRPSWRWRG